MDTCFRFGQLEKALLPISVTESEMMTDSREVKSLKEPEGMVVTVSGITSSVICVPFKKRLSKVKEEHNALEEMKLPKSKM